MYCCTTNLFSIVTLYYIWTTVKTKFTLDILNSINSLMKLAFISDAIKFLMFRKPKKNVFLQVIDDTIDYALTLAMMNSCWTTFFLQNSVFLIFQFCFSTEQLHTHSFNLINYACRRLSGLRFGWRCARVNHWQVTFYSEISLHFSEKYFSFMLL